MNLQNIPEKRNFALNLKNVSKSERNENEIKTSKRYEPSNILIKNYLAASGVLYFLYTQ